MDKMDLDRRKRRRLALRRRRREERIPISANLLLDERMREDIGIVSDDLWADLFPSDGKPSETETESASSNSIVRYVAITPWMPASLASPNKTLSSWTIIPVKKAPKADGSGQTRAGSPHSSIRVPAASRALQSLGRTIRRNANNYPGKLPILSNTQGPKRVGEALPSIEIRVLDVVPAQLSTVFVTIDAAALKKLYDSQAKFGGGFGGENGSPLKHKAVNGLKGKGSTNGNATSSPGTKLSMDETWRLAVKEALLVTGLIHSGDQVPLPLPSHPISHIPPPPAKIMACEPVAQGLVLPTTQVVIIKSKKNNNVSRKAPVQAVTSPIGNGIPEEDEDTSNETFYSAAEERGSPMASATQDEDTEATDDLSETQSIMDNEGDLEDDDVDDLIALSTPLLPPQASGVYSAFDGATPRAGAILSGNIGTPGSLLSTSTIRGTSSSSRSKVFKVQELFQKIPDDLLYPRPSSEDDEEARIYVETSALIKLGCFSGDWVRIENAPEPDQSGLGLNQFSFENMNEENSNWRPVKVFGLPDARKGTNWAATRGNHNRKPGYTGGVTLTAYTSPILLANMQNPSHIRIAPLQEQQTALPSALIRKPKITSSSMPPVASEVKILKILTPLSHDLYLQSSLFAELKDYFEGKRRVLKTGDLVAISFDESLGRSVHQTGNDNQNEDLLSRSKRSRATQSYTSDSRRTSVAWFKVSSVQAESPKQDELIGDWGGVAYVEASTNSSSTKLMQKANEPSRLPPTYHGTWQYYLGMRRVPPSAGSRLGGAISPNMPEPYVSEMRRRLRGLISAATLPQAVALRLPPSAILVHSTQRQIGKAMTVERACQDLGYHYCIIDAFDATTNSAAGTSGETEEFVKQRAQRALACGPENTVLLFKKIDAFTGDRMLSVFKDLLAESRVIVATTTEVDKIPEGIRSLFTYELEVNAPDEKEREGLLRDIVDEQSVRVAPDVELSSVALKTAALVAGDLVDVVNRATICKRTRLETIADNATQNSSPSSLDMPVTVRDLEIAGGSSALCLNKSDFESAVDAARKNFADAIGAPKIPNVSWDDVGGLTHVKEAVVETIQLPLARPELFAKGMKKRSGILFYGPPGTGKTLLAKAIATEFSLNFFSVKGPELLNMYIGESEANVRRVFQRARDARPCVVFFDELDSVAPKRGNQGDSGGVMDRIVSQLLAELDGMSNGEEGGGGVFVIGATNRPDLLDQALLRPGRFDKMLYLGISDTHEKQLKIMEALTRKFTLNPSCSLQRVSNTLPFTYTGADLYALCSDAMLKAITRAAQKVDSKVAAFNNKLRPSESPITIAQFFDHHATDDDVMVTVTEEDFFAAHKELVPSVSAEEFAHYERVRRTFEGTDGTNGAGAGGTGTSGNGQKEQARLKITQSQNKPNTVLPERISTGSGGGAKSYQGSNNSATVKSPASKTPTTVGFGRPNSMASSKVAASDRSTFYFDQTTDGHDEDDEEFVIRTDHLQNNAVNGGFGDQATRTGFGFGNSDGAGQARHSNGSTHGHGHGKAKRKSQTQSQGAAFGSATNGDEDLYQ